MNTLFIVMFLTISGTVFQTVDKCNSYSAREDYHYFTTIGRSWDIIVDGFILPYQVDFDTKQKYCLRSARTTYLWLSDKSDTPLVLPAIPFSCPEKTTGVPNE